MVIPQLSNDRRSLDFVADQFIDGRRMRILIRRSGRRKVARLQHRRVPRQKSGRKPPSQFTGKGTLFASEKILSERPETVKKFVRATKCDILRTATGGRWATLKPPQQARRVPKRIKFTRLPCFSRKLCGCGSNVGDQMQGSAMFKMPANDPFSIALMGLGISLALALAISH